jgi:hypothetical protein
VFSEDELHQARSIPVLEVAERYGAKLTKEGERRVGPCPACGGEDRFSVRPRKNWWYCRGSARQGGREAISLEMHLGGLTFIEAVRSLIGEDAGTPKRRQPTPEEIAARREREAERERAEAYERARNDNSAARYVSIMRPLAISPPALAFLSDARRIDVSHRALARVLESTEAIGWCDRVFFRQDNPDKPGHELSGQWLGAIIAILTDPVTGEPTGGISRTFVHEGRKVCRAMSLGGRDRLGIARLSPDDEAEGGLHLVEGIENGLAAMVMGYRPVWAAGSSNTLAKFPVIDGFEHLTAFADADEVGEAAAREVCQRWADAGRGASMKISEIAGEDVNDVLRRLRA